MRLKYILVLLLIWLTVIAEAQIADSVTYKQVQFIKLNQANDLYTMWFQSDKYFTDGIDIELAHSIFGNKVSDKVLFGFKNTIYKDFTLSFSQDIYTPENTTLSTVDSTDRPYAGQMYIVYAKYSNRFWQAKKLISKFYLGVQGPSAYAKEMQNGVHEAIGNNQVMGWDNQLSNGLILDYEMEYLQLIPVSSSFTELHGFGIARIGTINTSAELGFRFKIGRYTDSYMNLYGIANRRNKHHFNAADIANMSDSRIKIIPKKVRSKSLEEQSVYLSNKLNRKFQVYFFTEGSAKYTLRDGSVEGSLIQFSPNIYEYNYSDYNHFSLGGRYGIVFQYAGFYMEFTRYLHTDTYQEEGFFGYGRIILSWVF